MLVVNGGGDCGDGMMPWYVWYTWGGGENGVEGRGLSYPLLLSRPRRVVVVLLPLAVFLLITAAKLPKPWGGTCENRWNLKLTIERICFNLCFRRPLARNTLDFMHKVWMIPLEFGVVVTSWVDPLLNSSKSIEIQLSLEGGQFRIYKKVERWIKISFIGNKKRLKYLGSSSSLKTSGLWMRNPSPWSHHPTTWLFSPETRSYNLFGKVFDLLEFNSAWDNI